MLHKVFVIIFVSILYQYLHLSKDPEFLQANRLLQGQQHIKRDQGNETSCSKKWVSKKDLDKMCKHVCTKLENPDFTA